jgi:hypothetical protein
MNGCKNDPKNRATFSTGILAIKQKLIHWPTAMAVKLL